MIDLAFRLNANVCEHCYQGYLDGKRCFSQFTNERML